MADEIYRPDLSLNGKLRRRLARLQHRRPAAAGPPRPMISFAFDDAPSTAITVGGEILRQRGVRGVYFIAAGLAGTRAHMGPFATREEVVQAAREGHEIACHTYSHLDCGRADGAAIAADLERNRSVLVEWGLAPPATFAYPYGDVSAAAKRAAGARFALARALHPGLLEAGADLNQAPAVGVEGPHGEALARRWIERAAARGAWLILFTHGVEPEPTPFGVSADGLARLVDEALARGLEAVTVAEGARRMGAAL